MSRDKEDLIAMEAINNLKKFNFMFVKVDGYSIYVKGRDDIKQRMAINLIRNMLREQLPKAQLLVKWIK